MERRRLLKAIGSGVPIATVAGCLDDDSSGADATDAAEDGEAESTDGDETSDDGTSDENDGGEENDDGDDGSGDSDEGGDDGEDGSGDDGDEDGDDATDEEDESVEDDESDDDSGGFEEAEDDEVGYAGDDEPESGTFDGGRYRFGTAETRCGEENDCRISADDERVFVSGVVPASDPCHRATIDALALEDGSLEVTAGVESTASNCEQCVGTIEYELEVEFEDGFPTSTTVAHESALATGEVASERHD